MRHHGPIAALRQLAAATPPVELTPEESGAFAARSAHFFRRHQLCMSPHTKRTTLVSAERATREELSRLWRERERTDVEREPSLAVIPRFFVPKNRSFAAAPSSAAIDAGSLQQQLQGELSKLARNRLREHMSSFIVEPPELERLWHELRQHSSPPRAPTDDRINYDDFCQVAEAMPARCRRAFFCASHFLKFKLDLYGRISVLHYFQWVRRKVALMQTRSELALFDSTGDGFLSERELEMWIGALIPTLPALAELREEFFPFYKITAVRKFLFFLDPRRRGRVSIRAMLASPVTHELLELRRPDLAPEELRHNWFSLPYAEMLYADYLELDTDQNGLLSASELGRYRGGGLTTAFVSRIFQECQTYRNRETGQSEIDYKSYLDFVLATTYKGTSEALAYFMRLLDVQRAGGLTAFDVCYFFRAVVEKFDEFGEEANCTVEDVKDEIYDMVKPSDPTLITLRDLEACKVGDTVVGMLTDMHAFWQYDRREQLMDHGGGGEEQS
jgi:serine/threonine-protein phosphatase 2A regulatory subunit B''